MPPKLLDMLGLIFALFGAITLAYGLIIPPKRAIKAGVSRISEDTDEQNIKLPHVQDRLRESRFALLGVIFFAVGFLLQLIAGILTP